MKKLLLLTIPALFACGAEEPTQSVTFSAHEVSISKAEVCENLDASIRNGLDAGTHEELCGYPKICQDFESELVCDGDWCVVHRFCRLN